MKFVLTGGNGFIGQHLAEVLEKQGHAVNLLNRDMLSSIHDMTDELKKIAPDYIIHLAAYGNHFNQRDEAETLNANIIKLFKLLKASESIDYKGFINFSTSSVQLDVQTMYSATKAAGEHICKAYAQKYNKPIISVRPASVFGEGEETFRFIPMVVHSLKSGQQMNLDKDAMHSWIYVGDFVNALIFIARNITSTKLGEVINISYGKEWSNLDIVKMLEEIEGKTLRFKETPNIRPYDSKHWFVDNLRLNDMGWRTNYGIVRGLANTYKWYTNDGNNK